MGGAGLVTILAALHSGGTNGHELVFSAVSIEGLEGCMQQSCQSQSWTELEGAH